MFELYKDREMSGCHLELYQVCQEGHQLVRYLELDFDEGSLIPSPLSIRLIMISISVPGVLKCEVPKSSLQVALEALELLFFIDSRPVVGLLFLLVLNGALYLLLIPIAVCSSVCVFHLTLSHCVYRSVRWEGAALVEERKRWQKKRGLYWRTHRPHQNHHLHTFTHHHRHTHKLRHHNPTLTPSHPHNS